MGILRQAQEAQQVLHVGGLEEAQASVLDKGDVAGGQLEFEEVAVVGRANEHGLRRQPRPLLVVLQDAGADLPALVGLVVAPHERGPAPDLPA